MTEEKEEKKLLQWHAAFFADIQIELAEEAQYLEFENEHMLGTKPMQLDVLIIKKDNERKIRKNIGRIFRRHNIVEYKSPTDSLCIDDFFKVYGYACFYKADTRKVNEIKADEVTITFVCLGYPRELCSYLEHTMHRSITRVDEGIYYISDSVFQIQLLVQKRLSEKENFWLKSLTNDLVEKPKAERLLAEYKKHESDLLYRSVMNIIVRANRERLEVNDMCEALDELLEFHFKGKLQAGWEEGRAKGMAEGRVEGRAEGRLEVLLSLVRDRILSTEEAAKRADMAIEDMQALLLSAEGV